MTETNLIRKCGRAIGIVFIVQLVAMALSLCIEPMLDAAAEKNKQKSVAASERIMERSRNAVESSMGGDDGAYSSAIEANVEDIQSTGQEVMEEGANTAIHIMILQWAAFLLSIASAIYGIIMVLKLKKAMGKLGAAGVLMLVTFGLLIVGSLLCQSAPWGFSSQLYLADHHGPETVAQFSMVFYGLSIVTMLVAYILYANKNGSFRWLRMASLCVIFGALFLFLGLKFSVFIAGWLGMAMAVLGGYGFTVVGWFKVRDNVAPVRLNRKLIFGSAGVLALVVVVVGLCQPLFGRIHVQEEIIDGTDYFTVVDKSYPHLTVNNKTIELELQRTDQAFRQESPSIYLTLVFYDGDGNLIYEGRQESLESELLNLKPGETGIMKYKVSIYDSSIEDIRGIAVKGEAIGEEKPIQKKAGDTAEASQGPAFDAFKLFCMENSGTEVTPTKWNLQVGDKSTDAEFEVFSGSYDGQIADNGQMSAVVTMPDSGKKVVLDGMYTVNAHTDNTAVIQWSVYAIDTATGNPVGMLEVSGTVTTQGAKLSGRLFGDENESRVVFTIGKY